MVSFLNIESPTILALALGIVGIILTIVLVSSASKAMKKLDTKNYVPVMATIIENVSNKRGVNAAIYNYSYGSTTHTVVGQYKSLTPYNVGTQVEIGVNPINPHENTIQINKTRELFLIIIIFVLVNSVLFIAFGLFSL